MSLAKRLSAAILAALVAFSAFGQVRSFPQILPANSVVGRLATNPGPSQAIPFATLAAQLGVGGTYLVATSISGTNTITGTTVGAGALATNQVVFFIPANTNTGATTFNRDSLGAINVFYNGVAAAGGELVAGVPAGIFYDGTQYNIIANGVAAGNAQLRGSVTAASTTNLDTSTSFYQQITGNTTITAITLANGHCRFVEFSGTPTITNGASLVLPGGANIVAAAGDTATLCGEASGVVRFLQFTKGGASGVPATQGTFTATGTGFTANPTGTATYSITNNIVTLRTPTLTGTSNATSFTITGLPAAIQPATAHGGFPVQITNNGTVSTAAGYASISNAGVITLSQDWTPANIWTNSGTKAITETTFTYSLN